jgi:hypothetical protein
VGWAHLSSVEELAVVRERRAAISKAAGNTALLRNVGNHDQAVRHLAERPRICAERSASAYAITCPASLTRCRAKQPRRRQLLFRRGRRPCA